MLPYEDVREESGWLLKLHGSVEEPKDIVLTRDDYLNYRDQRAALAGIVQALLITRTMLFVGFSLADDNFHQVANEVRKVVRRNDSSPRRFGVVLTLRDSPGFAELWKADLDVIVIGEGQDLPTRARSLDIFLDQLLAEATTGSDHLLDPAYHDALTEEQQLLANSLRTFRTSVPASATRAPEWAHVAGLLYELGDGVPLTRMLRLYRDSFKPNGHSLVWTTEWLASKDATAEALAERFASSVATFASYENAGQCSTTTNLLHPWMCGQVARFVAVISLLRRCRSPRRSLNGQPTCVTSTVRSTACELHQPPGSLTARRSSGRSSPIWSYALPMASLRWRGQDRQPGWQDAGQEPGIRLGAGAGGCRASGDAESAEATREVVCHAGPRRARERAMP